MFTLSDAPEIHSNGFHFKFDRTVEGNLLGYVVPHWCEPADEVRPDGTTIILPAANTYEFGSETLVDLNARLLLFLNKLRKLTLVHNGQSVAYRREDRAEWSTLSCTRDIGSGEQLPEEMHYVREELALPMKDRYSDEKRPGIEQSSVVLAFPVDDTGAASPEPASHVFAFLPIRQMGFRFSIQADFILSSSRKPKPHLPNRQEGEYVRSGFGTGGTCVVNWKRKNDRRPLYAGSLLVRVAVLHGEG